MKKFNFSVDLINDSILKSLLIFSIPILVSNIFQQLYNMADIAIVGHTLGDNSLAAIGASAAIFELIFGFALGIGNGLSMVAARSYGANNKNLLKKSVAGSIVIGLMVTIAVMILSRFILMPLLKILHTPENIINEAFEYINIITMFIGVTFSYNLSSGLLRAIGNSFMSLVFLVIASILNIFLDIYFITSLKMGIGGAAVATVIAQAISVILSVIYIYIKEPILIPRKKHFRFDAKLYRELLGQGISMGLMIAIVLTGSLILQYAINGFGYLIIAGHTSARKLMGFCNIPLTTMALALATFVSQNKGADRVDRIRKGVFYANLMDIFFAIGITIFVYLFSKNMIHLMSGSNSEVVLYNGSTYLKIASPFFTILGVLFNLRYALQALGEKVIPLVSSIIEFFGKIIFVIFIVPKLGYFGVMICEPLIWIVMTGQLAWAFYGNGYMKGYRKVKEEGIKNNKNFTEEQCIELLAKELEKEKLIIFVGAGVSKNSGLPNWNELIKEYAKELGIKKENFKSDEILKIPEKYFKKFGEIKYYKILNKIFSGKYEPNSIHEVLKKMNLNYIVTTNYDNLIETKINSYVVSEDTDLPHYNTNTMVIKMHGDIVKKNVVLKKSDYKNYETNFPLISTYLKGLFTTNTILFIGYSFNDASVQQIMKWIRNILKNDTKQAFLVDLNSNTIIQDKNKEQLITRIPLKVLNNEYEKTLESFLKKIIVKKIEISKESKFEIYTNLNYLPEQSLKKIDPYFTIWGTDNQKVLIIQRIGKLFNFEKYKDVFYKSFIIKIIKQEKSENQEIDMINQNQENLKKFKVIESKILKSIYNYDYNNFKNLANEYLNNKLKNINKLIIVYGFIFFLETEKAKSLINKMITEDRLKNHAKEKIIWNYFVIKNIEIIGKNVVELKRIYYDYYKEKNQLYEEIFNYSTLESINDEMNKLFDEIRNKKSTLYFQETPLEKAKKLSKDLFYFCSLNGIYNKYFSNSNYLESIKKYIEILFIAYTNKIKEEYLQFKGINVLNEFTYFDFYLMLEIDYSKLESLCNQFNINKLNCEDDVSNEIINTFKNILEWRLHLKSIQDNRNNLLKAEECLSKLLLLISKLSLSTEQLKYIIKIILEYRDIGIFFQKAKPLIIKNFKQIIDKNYQNLDKEIFENIFDNIMEIKCLDEQLVNNLTYYFLKNKTDKFSENSKIATKISNLDLEVKSYFLRVVKKDFLEEIKNEINYNFNILGFRIYMFLWSEGYITELEKEFEKNIEILMNHLFPNTHEEYIAKSAMNGGTIIISQKEFINYLLTLILNDFLSNTFKEKLRNYNNKDFFEDLKSDGLEEVWEYLLSKEKYDLSKFTENELRLFPKSEIKNLLGSKNDNLLNTVKKYVKSHLPNDKILEAYFEYTDENDADGK